MPYILLYLIYVYSLQHINESTWVEFPIKYYHIQTLDSHLSPIILWVLTTLSSMHSITFNQFVFNVSWWDSFYVVIINLNGIFKLNHLMARLCFGCYMKSATKKARLLQQDHHCDRAYITQPTPFDGRSWKNNGYDGIPLFWLSLMHPWC